MIKNKIYRYFFYEFFKIFILVSLSFSLLIWFTQAARLLELVTEYGNPVSVYVKYLIFIYPKILNNTYLLNFIISLFFLFAKLENDKEIQIYFLSGISKSKLYLFCIYIGISVLIISICLSIFISPWSSYQGKMVLGKSEFSFINSLVKEKNFNSPLKGLTIYVEENDNKGNLKDIFIYENNRTIIAKTGQVLTDDKKTFLKLYNGVTQEKLDDKINLIKFSNTVFDFSSYKLKNTSYVKFSERNLTWLLNNLSRKEFAENKRQEIREEINKRTIKHFLILFLTSIICLLLFRNDEKINLKKFKLIIYICSFLILIINEFLIDYSSKSLYHTYRYISILFCLFIIFNFIFFKFIQKESAKWKNIHRNF